VVKEKSISSVKNDQTPRPVLTQTAGAPEEEQSERSPPTKKSLLKDTQLLANLKNRF